MALRAYALKHGGFFTNYVKNLSQGRISRYKWIFYLEQLYMIALMARIVATLSGKPDYRQFDPLMSLIHSKLNEPLLWLVIFNVAFACAIFRQLFHDLPNNTIYKRMLYETVVHNSEAISSSVKSDDVIARMVNLEAIRMTADHGVLCRLLSQTTISRLAKFFIEWRNDDIDQSKLGKLRMFPNLNFEIRAKLAKITLTFDMFGYAFFPFLYTTMALTCAIPFFYLTRYQPLWTAPLIALDLFMICHCLDLYIRIGNFGSLSSYFKVPLYVDHPNSMSSEMARIVTDHKQRGLPWLRGKEIIFLYHFLAEHLRISVYMLKESKEFVSKVYFATQALNMPINIALISRIVLQSDRLSEFQLLLTWASLLIHSSIIFGLILPAAQYSKALHRPRHYIPPLNMYLHSSQIRMQLKLNSFYSRLTTGRKIGVQVGPGAIITSKFIYKCIAVYVGYLIATFNFIIENSL